MQEQKVRTTIFYKNYFIDFYSKQRQKVKDKIIWTIRLIETIEHIPKDYFDHMTGTEGIFEIRVKVGSDIFRIFCFFDEGRLIVLANGFQKKTQKTPKNEIEFAEKIKIKYETEKHNKS
jgi:phage-related protein